MTEPLKPLGHETPEELSTLLQVNLGAPLVLTSWFLRVCGEGVRRRKVVFLTSGSANLALPGMGAYCASKAGLNQAVRCLGLEQRGRGAVEVAAINPGMVETELQRAIRRKPAAEFPAVALFHHARAWGLVLAPDLVAPLVLRLVHKRQRQGAIVDAVAWWRYVPVVLRAALNRRRTVVPFGIETAHLP